MFGGGRQRSWGRRDEAETSGQVDVGSLEPDLDQRIAPFGTSVDPGTQDAARPLTRFSHRPEPPAEDEGVKSQIQRQTLISVCVHRPELLSESVIGYQEWFI